MPTVICFFDGITKNGQRQIGFIGLDPVPGGNEDEWPTTALESVLGNTGVINYVAKVGGWFFFSYRWTTRAALKGPFCCAFRSTNSFSTKYFFSLWCEWCAS